MSERSGGISAWAVVIPVRRYEAERLFHHDTLDLTGLELPRRPSAGDEVLVVVDRERPLVVALGRVRAAVGEEHDPDDPQSADGVVPLVVSYTRRAFDEPVPLAQLTLDGPVTEIDPMTYREVADRLGPPAGPNTWMVRLDAPIEAESPAEAVRIFWSYVLELGPRELPTFVSPADNELAMQAYVSGEEANQDPEED